MEALIQLIKNMGSTKLAIIGSVSLVVLISIILLTVNYSSRDMVPLYGDLDITDSNTIVTELEAQNIPYQLRANGSTILVPEDKVLRLRMRMAEQGIPAKGSIVGYEIFDNSDSLGTSNFVQNVNLLRALEGELSRTIASLSRILTARVHLVMPTRELFSREKQLPSASIVISTRGGYVISKAEINAIGNLVATAVPGLDLNKITIVDSGGRPLKLGSKDGSSYNSSSNAEEFRVEYENRLKNTIEELLEQSVGPGHIKVQVSAEINFDRTVINSETYDPEGQVIRSVQEISDKELSSDKMNDTNVSVANNLPNVNSDPAAGGDSSSSSSEHTDTTTNYEISKTIKNHVTETGKVMRLSVAVLVDGIYKTDPQTNKVSYTPRTIEELKQFELLVKSAAGFDASRNDIVEIVNMQFTTDLTTLEGETISKTLTEWFKSELTNIAQSLMIAVVLILLLLTVVRPMAIKAFESYKENENLQLAAASGVSGVALMGSAGKSVEPNAIRENEKNSTGEVDENGILINDLIPTKSGTYKNINDIFERYPQESLSVIKKFISERV